VIRGLIAASARYPIFTLLAVLAAGAWGVYALLGSPLDAIPDLSDTQVIVATEWPGRSPDLVEDQVTYPIVTSLQSAPGVRYVRGQSMPGDSFVYVIFEDGTDLYWARSRVLEYLAAIRARLPEGVVPTLGPDATSVGWVFEYALVDTTGRNSLADLRSFQDWQLRYWLEGLEGVAEVAPVGGFVRQYQVEVDPNRLLAYGVTLADVAQAIKSSNQQVGAGVVEVAEQEHLVRGRGYIRSREDLEQVSVGAGRVGAPILLAELARVTLGPAPRRGIAELDGRGEVVGGIVVMRQGENALRVIDRVKARLAEVKAGFQAGVELVVTYDRSVLIEGAVETLRRELLQEMAIVALVILLFLWHLRSALIPVLTLPIAVLLSFIPMTAQGLTANIMSLGGIAVAIGAMVDASIIMVENVHRRLEEWQDRPGEVPRPAVVLGALQEVGPSLFFALLVITISFLPIFSLEGAEGRLFRPLAFGKTYAMAFAAVLAVTLTPALVVLLLRGRVRPEREHPLYHALIRGYAPVVRWAVRRRRLVVGLAVLAVLSAVPAFLSLGSEFMPPLNEGTILYMPTAPPGISEAEALTVLQDMDRRLQEFPEVKRVFGKIGRAQSATDPAPLSMVETVVTLEPESRWRPGMTWERLVEEMDAKLRYPGMPNIWWMPIQTRIEMLATGVRSKVAVKVFGPDLGEVERIGREIEGLLRDVPGTRSVYAERSGTAFYLDVDVDRESAARYGLKVEDVHSVVEAAVGGMPVTQTVEGRSRYAVTVRYPRGLRDDAEDIERILVPTRAGAQVPLVELATVRHTTGPSMIQEEDGQLVGLVSVDVADRPIVQYVADARRTLASRLTLPAGYRLDWAGQFQYYERARQRLSLVVPITLLLVFFLLYLNLRSVTQSLIVMLAVPFSLVGAVWLVALLGYNLNVAIWVGMIALAGLDAETGAIMLLYLNLSYRDRLASGRLRDRDDLEEAIVEGAAHRIRPKLMTILAILMGLMPIMWGHGAGSDVMRQIAAPMVGGVITSFLLELVVYPAIYAGWRGRGLPA
jgi:Cu(I)/Ag(I) efflux system membrane protein CusA/SilA